MGERSDERTSVNKALKKNLCECALCSVLPEEDISRILEEVAEGSYRGGDILFRAGDPADRFFVIMDGHVALYLDDEGGQSRIARIAGPGETFAEASICGQGTYPVTAEVLDSASIVTIPGQPLCALLEQRFDLVLSVLGQMSLQLRGQIRQIMDLKMKTSAQRLAACLVRFAESENNAPVGGGATEIRLPYGKKLLADELGMQPETLSRAFLKVQSVGVRYQRAENIIQIDDVGVLRDFCEGAKPLL